ncbi:hypothetical protein BH753_gp158 [Bacillus phage Shbh1]|uniref:Uncharacterized protein n=1 Tax=Bacillus phage Shbh1 TaxID=1796992 RepID=A0A142F1I3_9CAUD|nr:hypothetical protein BH753_gp158 [Bacillus phage Shbh1]AMQ66640.1 hypothetical protein [Bacillus phage Shbh1]
MENKSYSWIVWDNVDGLVVKTDDYQEALTEYNKCVKWAREVVDCNDGFEKNENIVLAKVEKHFFSYDTGNPVIDYDENGEEFEVLDSTYWSWKEISYD